MTKPLVYDLSFQEISQVLESWGEPKYRSQQIWKGIYQSLWQRADDFTPLPKALRLKLFDHFTFSHLTPVKTSDSTDGETRKILFQLPDKHLVETVKMQYSKRRTLCISTQSGCAMGCVFCATGQMGFLRNLSTGEIIEQILFFARTLAVGGDRITNIVFMGMGEPFHNYDNVMRAIEILNQPDGMNLGSRRFTISTVGLVPQIRKLTGERLRVNLAVSLHAADDELRTSMLPVNNKYPLGILMESLDEYMRITKRRVTFEWALINGVNDTPDQARKLSNLLRGKLAHVNLIPLNITSKYRGKASSRKRQEEFKSILESNSIPCSVRLRRGIDIQAGCGQLADSFSSR